MVVHFGKWGNSLALRLPAALARQIGASEGSAADLMVQNGRLIVKPVVAPRYDLTDLVACMNDENNHDDIAAGGPVGKEVW